MSQPYYDDDLFFNPKQEKYCGDCEGLKSELKEVIKALITASPSHLRWVEKKWKDYL